MAKDLGLVDELGGIDKALNAAATQAGIENYSIIGYPEKENIFASCWAIRKTLCKQRNQRIFGKLL